MIEPGQGKNLPGFFALSREPQQDGRTLLIGEMGHICDLALFCVVRSLWRHSLSVTCEDFRRNTLQSPGESRIGEAHNINS